MKNEFNYISVYGLTLCIFLSGCKKFVEIDAPTSQIISEVVYQKNETANSAMIAIYARMFVSGDASPYQLGALPGLAADELTNNNSLMESIYNNTIDPAASNQSNAFWLEAYKMIYYANSVYEGCEKSSSLDAEVKTRLMGEALFIRAYWHFYLVNLYGNIPLALSTSYNVNSTLVRKPVAEVYQQIITDLKAAQSVLGESYFSAAGSPTESQRIRPNKSAATALLSRVYLFTGDYPSAEEQSTLLIANSSKFNLAPIDQTFLATDNKEAIWQLMPANNSPMNSVEGFNFIPTESSITESRPTISSQLLEAFESGDLRKSQWIGNIDDGTGPQYFAYKYKVPFGGENPTEYSVILRLAEQFLIRAEARVQQNNLAGAISDVDAIRERAGLPLIVDINPDISKGDLLTAILRERQSELFTEQGHRWFDLKRTKTVDVVMQTVTPLKGGGTWNSTKQLWPIPQTEIANNPNLTQNLGYNR